MKEVLLDGDSLEVLKTLEDCSVDSIVTDPPYELGFMGKSWDRSGIANNADVWREALRVLKPGGYLLSFGGSRTAHRMVCAIEDAGFEVRDQIMWIYGSGFPKSHNLSGDRQGWGTALKPAHEPICVARKPFKGTVAANVLKHGTGALNIDACRVPTGDKLGGGNNSADVSREGKHEGWKRPWMNDAEAATLSADRSRESTARSEALGRWPANIIHDGSDEVLDAFPDAPGQLAKVSATAPSEKTSNVYGKMKREGEVTANKRYTEEGSTSFAATPGERRFDTGSAARFFYCAKASKKDRGEGNDHPTVKPTDLMRYLVRLVTPPGGTVLDPFMGSGSTGRAAKLEGFSFIGIDITPAYVDIARKRIEETV